ncbi:MAG: hypothetical protein JWN34_416 [Bryobacterales bacterium]|nr:hypothetical protein [Bryobacterales bacterium]
MLKWFKKGAEEGTVEPPVIREIDSSTDLDSLLAQDTVMVFKHSTACPVSWSAHRQVLKFAAEHPDFPLYILPVIQQRAASNSVASKTDIRHESPQVILLRDRQVVATISHGEITASELDQLIAS